jgi:hypothetical protein
MINFELKILSYIQIRFEIYHRQLVNLDEDAPYKII